MEKVKVNLNYLDNDASKRIIDAGYGGYVWTRGDDSFVPILSAVAWLEKKGFRIDISHPLRSQDMYMGFVREMTLDNGTWFTIDSSVMAKSMSGALQGCIKHICDYLSYPDENIQEYDPNFDEGYFDDYDEFNRYDPDDVWTE